MAHSPQTNRQVEYHLRQAYLTAESESTKYHIRQAASLLGIDSTG
ncbi:hypothetical protein [Halogranum rubrum]|uniref:Uncharacterized protein n=1 Tax=Halogranum salarium B-1 TaxID=1210908 RepID=J2ZY74_9EURY|nr:hypothetical protein [Halogranum salarium]EJN57973.1 hypothetical protein HSB1_33900 [Halogranum salarium B-1]